MAENDEADKAPDEVKVQSFLNNTSQLAHTRDDDRTTLQSFTRRRIQEDKRTSED